MEDKIYEMMKQDIKIKLGNLFKKGIVYEPIFFNHIPVSNFLNLIQEIFPSEISDVSDILEQNGWESDYWFTFKYEGIEYGIRASGYYGTIEVTIEENELY